MRKVLKWIAIVLGVLIGLLLLIVAGVVIYSQVTFKRTVERPVYDIAADTSPEGVARGEYLVRTVVGCGGCHAPGEEPREKVAGPLIGEAQEINEGPMHVVFAVPNLTPDEATGLGTWSDGEIARAIREGLDKDGVTLAVMPSPVFHDLSDSDVAAIVGYLRSLEPVHNEIPPLSGNAFAKAALSLGLFGESNPTEPIAEPQAAPAPGSVEYGNYLVDLAGCAFCHGEGLTGGAAGGPGVDPSAPVPPNLTPSGELGGWTEEDFISTLRTGIKPDGVQLDEAMPWWHLGQMSDEDLSAIFKYLQSLPAASVTEG